MKNYIIFIKNNESKVIIKECVTREITNELKNKGFTRYPYTIEAESEKDAIVQVNKQGGEHLTALSEYSGSVFFYCAVVVTCLLLAFILN